MVPSIVLKQETLQDTVWLLKYLFALIWPTLILQVPTRNILMNPKVYQIFLDIEFLDVLVHKYNEKGYKQLYLRRKQSDNLIFMQNLTIQHHLMRVKRICSTNTEFECICRVLQEQFTKRGYNSSSIETRIKKIKSLDRKKTTTQKAQVLPLTVTYNRTLPTIKQIIQNHLSILTLFRMGAKRPAY